MTVHEAPHRPSASELTMSDKLGLPKDPSYREFVLATAGDKFVEKDFETALKLLKGIVMLWPDDARLYEAFAAIYQAQGELKKARVCFEVAVELDVGSIRANMNLGEIKWRIDKDKAGAKTHLVRVVKADPNGPFGRRAQLTLKRVA